MIESKWLFRSAARANDLQIASQQVANSEVTSHEFNAFQIASCELKRLQIDNFRGCTSTWVDWDIVFYRTFQVFSWILYSKILQIFMFVPDIWNKVFHNGSSKICGRQPLKNLREYSLLQLVYSACVPNSCCTYVIRKFRSGRSELLYTNGCSKIYRIFLIKKPVGKLYLK